MLGIVVQIAGIAIKIKHLVQNARANKKRCQRLSDRVAVLVPLVEQLSTDADNAKRYLLALQSLRTCVERCLTFIQTFIDSNWFLRIYDQACHRNSFDELNQSLTTCAEGLNLTLVVQQYFRSEQDEEDRREDRAFLQTNFDTILRLQSEYAQQQREQLTNIERMIQSLIDNNRQNLEALTDDAKRKELRDREMMFVDVKYNQVHLVELIAGGSSGNVYVGRFNRSKVVVKELKVSSMRGSERNEFVTAASILSHIRHENIVQFIGACIEEPNRYLVLSEYMPLGSLAMVLQATTTVFTWEDRWSIAKQIANGLLYLHTFPIPPIVHKDIKSSNILLDRRAGHKSYRAKVNDFGLDQIHTNVGTLPWSAPETLINLGARTYTPKSDVYSLGVVLWELATGGSPYRNYPTDKMIEEIRHGHRLPVTYDSVPFIYGDLLYQTWNDDVDERLSCEQVYARLVIGSKRRDRIESLWPDTEEKSGVHLDPANLLDHLLFFRHQYDRSPAERNVEQLNAVAEKIAPVWNVERLKKTLIHLNTTQHLIGIGGSVLERTEWKDGDDLRKSATFLRTVCHILFQLVQHSELNELILEQNGVVFLLNVIRKYAAKDNELVTKAAETLDRLKCEIVADNQESISTARDKNDSDAVLVIHRVVEQVQQNGKADKRVVTMIEDLLESSDHPERSGAKKHFFGRFFKAKRKSASAPIRKSPEEKK